MSQSILTFQLGNYSNFVGSHLWNLHEFDFEDKNIITNDIDYDVNYCEGFNKIAKETTFTPRLISWDWKQNLGARIIDDVYEEKDKINRNFRDIKNSSNNGNLKIYNGFSEEENKTNQTGIINDRQDYDEWNEFTYSRYHSKTLNSIPKTYRNHDSTNFHSFTQGLEMFDCPDMFDQMENQTRYFVEQCDYLQGFKLLSDLDGFSGLSIRLLDHLKDEYNKEIICFPTFNYFNTDNINQMFNITFLINSMNINSLLWSPLSLFNINKNTYRDMSPYIQYSTQSRYHTSALLATSIKSMLLPCLAKSSRYYLKYFECLVSGRRNKMTTMAMTTPFNLENSSSSLLNCLSHRKPNDLFTSLNPFCDEIDSIESVIGNIHGVDFADNSHKQQTMYKFCRNVNEMMEMYLNQFYMPENCKFFTSTNKFSLTFPYPKLFNKQLIDEKTGALLSIHQSSSSDPASFVKCCPRNMPLSSLLMTNNSDDALLKLYDSVRDVVKKRKFPSNLMHSEMDMLIDGVEKFRDIV